ncbi:MAG: DUF1850 domain-containing protein [Ideonella sp.]
MTWLRPAAAAAAACALLNLSAAAACDLVLTEHRSGHELARLPLDQQTPAATVSFTHSVLGTPVVDHYEWQDGKAHLVEERFEGDGYGLPNAAGSGQTMTRDGAGWRLHLDRIVDPLVMQPVQGMRVTIAGQAPLLLKSLGSSGSIALRAQGCSNHQRDAQ